MELLTERHADEIAGVLSCYDRILIQGTLPGLCYAEGMTAYLKARQIRTFDYAQFAQPLRDALRENAERLAAEHGLEIMFIRKRNFPKKTERKESSRSEGTIPAWCVSSRPWNLVRPTGPGMTRRPARPSCDPTTASACPTIFISSTKSWAWAMSAFPPGAPSGFRFTSTVITGWPRNCASVTSTTPCSTMPS